MFLRIFRYRVLAELRDRHLALQARASRLYEKYVSLPVGYFRRSSDPSIWVELHRYVDREECQKVAIEVAADPELARLWKDFQETLDPSYPPTLEEFTEYELPVSINASPFAQPPIDVKTTAAAAATVMAPSEVLEPVAPSREAPPAVVVPADAATQVVSPVIPVEVEPTSPIEPAHEPAPLADHAATVVEQAATVVERAAPPAENSVHESEGIAPPAEAKYTVVPDDVPQDDDSGLTIYEEPLDESQASGADVSQSPVHLAESPAPNDESADIWIDRADDGPQGHAEYRSDDVELTLEDDSEELTIEQGPPGEEQPASEGHVQPESHSEHAHPHEDREHEGHAEGGHGNEGNNHPEHGNGDHRQHDAEHDSEHDAPQMRKLTFNDGVWQVDPPHD